MLIEIDVCEINFQENDLRIPIFLNAKSPANFTVSANDVNNINFRILKVIKGDFLTVILHISGFRHEKFLTESKISTQVGFCYKYRSKLMPPKIISDRNAHCRRWSSELYNAEKSALEKNLQNNSIKRKMFSMESIGSKKWISDDKSNFYP